MYSKRFHLRAARGSKVIARYELRARARGERTPHPVLLSARAKDVELWTDDCQRCWVEVAEEIALRSNIETGRLVELYICIGRSVRQDKVERGRPFFAFVSAVSPLI